MLKQKAIAANNPTHLEMLVRNAIKGHGLDCDLNHIDVSSVTDFRGIFRKYPNFTGDVSGWNLSDHARKDMFETIAQPRVVANDCEQLKIFVRQAIKANGLSCSLNHIDTSGIGMAIDLFREHPGFNGDISQWNVAELTATDVVFKKVPLAPAVARDRVHLMALIKDTIKVNGLDCVLNHIDVQNVEGCMDLFNEFPGFAGDISTWHGVKRVGNGLVFKEIAQSPIVARDRDHLVELIKHVVELNGLECSLNHIDVGQIRDFRTLFTNLPEFNGDISQWNTRNALSMEGMFQGSSFNGDISGWDVSKVRSMKHMFASSKFNRPIGNWNVSSVQDFVGLFAMSSFSQPLSAWNPRSGVDMSAMFACTTFNDDISGWNVSNVRCTTRMFLKGTFAQDISRWQVHPEIKDHHMVEMWTGNPHFLEAQSMSPWMVRLHLVNKTIPLDPTWQQAMALSAPIAQGLDLSTSDHAHAIVATHAGIVDSMDASHRVNETLFESAV